MAVKEANLRLIMIQRSGMTGPLGTQMTMIVKKRERPGFEKVNAPFKQQDRWLIQPFGNSK